MKSIADVLGSLHTIAIPTLHPESSRHSHIMKRCDRSNRNNWKARFSISNALRANPSHPDGPRRG